MAYLDPYMRQRFAPLGAPSSAFDLRAGLGFPSPTPTLAAQYQAAAAPPPPPPVAQTGVPLDENRREGEETADVPGMPVKKPQGENATASLAKKGLGIAGAAAGSAILPGIGTAIGGGLGSFLGSLF